MWKFGGYHLDCGCFPINNGVVTFPEPKSFGIVANLAEGQSFPHCKVKFQSGTVCATLVKGNQVFTAMVMAGAITDNGTSKLKRLLDVWLLRSTAGHKAAQIALEFYVKGWFAIQATNDLSEDLKAQAMRELIISAVTTGVTHSGHGVGCSGDTLFKSHLIDATFTPPEVASMNIRKVGYGSHR
jgi:hypothetical protein